MKTNRLSQLRGWNPELVHKFFSAIARIGQVKHTQRGQLVLVAVAFLVLCLSLFPALVRAEGLNTGFNDSFWRRARAAKGAPDAGAQGAVNSPSGVGASPENARTDGARGGGAGGGRQITRSSPEVCSQMAETLADSPCSFISSCSTAMGTCTSAQRSCTTAACVRGYSQKGSGRGGGGSGRASGTPVAAVERGEGQLGPRPEATGGPNRGRAQEPQPPRGETGGSGGNGNTGITKTQLRIENEVQRMISTSEDPNVTSSQGQLLEWQARTDKVARATQHADWVRNRDHRAVADPSVLVSAADAFARAHINAGAPPKPPLPVVVEARRMIMDRAETESVQPPTQEQLQNWRARGNKLVRAMEHAAWVRSTDHRELTASAHQLVAEADRMAAEAVFVNASGGALQPALQIGVEARRMMMAAPQTDNVVPTRQACLDWRARTDKLVRATEYATGVRNTNGRQVADPHLLVAEADAIATQTLGPAP